MGFLCLHDMPVLFGQTNGDQREMEMLCMYFLYAWNMEYV